MDRKEILNCPTDKFLISIYKIYLHVTPPPSGLQHKQTICLYRKQGWIGLLSQHTIKWIGLNAS